EAGQDPARWSRVFWAFALGVVPITLMFIDGGLRVILSATIVVSLPLLVIGVLMCRSLLKMLREDAGPVVTEVHPPKRAEPVE
ncbi:MAG: BCCT family transporter, partial [Gammaproteobacteria bacterium]|nr:BCCT family transporter [Gammaproteobacteria bacterium]